MVGSEYGVGESEWGRPLGEPPGELARSSNQYKSSELKSHDLRLSLPLPRNPRIDKVNTPLIRCGKELRGEPCDASPAALSLVYA